MSELQRLPVSNGRGSIIAASLKVYAIPDPKIRAVKLFISFSLWFIKHFADESINLIRFYYCMVVSVHS